VRVVFSSPFLSQTIFLSWRISQRDKFVPSTRKIFPSSVLVFCGWLVDLHCVFHDLLLFACSSCCETHRSQ